MSKLLNSCTLQPKFLSKEERATIAIAKRAQELREQKEKEEKLRQDRDALEKEADDIRQKDRSQPNRYGGGNRSQCINILILVANL
jgi:ATP-dependent RNA helicase DDX23/PRP28